MKTFRMKFLTDLGKTFVVSLNYAKESISAAEAEAAMEAVIDGDIFDQVLVSIAGAELVDRTVTEIL
jgi:hypothetical protein